MVPSLGGSGCVRDACPPPGSELGRPPLEEGAGRRPLLDSRPGLGGRIRSVLWEAKPVLLSAAKPRTLRSGKDATDFWEAASERLEGGIFAGVKRPQGMTVL